MEEKEEKVQTDEWLKNLPLQSQNEGFKPEEMIACPQCERKNAPTRIKCLYCGAELPAVTEISAVKHLSRKLEAWEKGFNIIFLPSGKNLNTENFGEIAKILRLDKEDLQKIFETGKPLPLACAESEAEAEIISKHLKEKGIDSIVLGGEKLEINKPARRLRGIEFFADKIILILFNSDEIAEIACEDLFLIVSGAVFERKIEATQKRQRSKENKVLETTELSTDELLIDIYSRRDTLGYRIEAKGFDFSCLASEKKLLAAQNMKNLLEKFHAVAPAAKFDTDYISVRAELSRVWEVEQNTNSKGIQKKGFGQYNLESVTTINNLRQFTRYSRLRRNLL
ncbi:MAG: hypothetical protein ACR2LT_08790 [Pyrinomonadaceae bacterium]